MINAKTRFSWVMLYLLRPNKKEKLCNRIRKIVRNELDRTYEAKMKQIDERRDKLSHE
jgi:hypothetical protein